MLAETMFHELIAAIDPAALAHNLRLLTSHCKPSTKICVALKADAYGHGLAQIAPLLQQAPEHTAIDCAAVATLAEAIDLRRTGWARPILVLGNVLAGVPDADRRDRITAILDHHLSPTLTDPALVAPLAAAAAGATRKVEVHLKFDSGMGRQGIMPADLPALVDAVRAQPSLRLGGIYSHFATADLSAHDLAAKQLATFRRLLTELSDRLPPGVTRHMANTAATLTWPEAHFDMVRPGLGLYGYAPSDDLRRQHDLRPVLRLSSRVTLVKQLPPGHCVGYGQTFTTARPTRLGIIPAGYADGLLRALSNHCVVGTSAGDAPIIGRVSMDQLAIDLTDLPAVNVGDEIVLIDNRPDRPNSVEQLAKKLNTIPYEVTCLLGSRVNRVVRPHDAPRP